MTHLEVGDYNYGVVGIERKSDDFLDFDKLLQQTQELKQNFGNRAFLVVDCNLEDLVKLSKLYHKKDMTNSILGLTASLAVRMNLPPIFCSNSNKKS